MLAHATLSKILEREAKGHFAEVGLGKVRCQVCSYCHTLDDFMLNVLVYPTISGNFAGLWSLISLNTRWKVLLPWMASGTAQFT